jgi:hypothetical protein
MDTEQFEKRLKALTRHVNNVLESCILLGNRLIDNGERSLGLELISNGYTHDHSKFSGAEWLYLNEESKEKTPELFFAALLQHQSTNPHHPEYWQVDSDIASGIKQMPRLYIAEMVCDWKARSNEFGTDLRGWIKEKATKKWMFTFQSSEYKQIKDMVDLLLDSEFK